jgi:hypothetical protein
MTEKFILFYYILFCFQKEEKGRCIYVTLREILFIDNYLEFKHVAKFKMGQNYAT